MGELKYNADGGIDLNSLYGGSYDMEKTPTPEATGMPAGLDTTGLNFENFTKSLGSLGSSLGGGLSGLGNFMSSDAGKGLSGLGELGLGIAGYLEQKKAADINRKLGKQQLAYNTEAAADRDRNRKAMTAAFNPGLGSI